MIATIVLGLVGMVLLAGLYYSPNFDKARNALRERYEEQDRLRHYEPPRGKDPPRRDPPPEPPRRPDREERNVLYLNLRTIPLDQLRGLHHLYKGSEHEKKIHTVRRERVLLAREAALAALENHRNRCDLLQRLDGVNLDGLTTNQLEELALSLRR